MKFVPNDEGFRELRESPAALAAIDRITADIAARAGEGYVAEPARVYAGGRGRARGAVITGTIEARVQEAQDHTLLKAFGTTRA